MKASLFAALILPIAVALPLAAQTSAAVTPQDTMISVDGLRLHLRVYRAGPRAVLMESGFGLDADEWNGVAPEIVAATGASVVSYDRAGFGQSDLAPDSADIRQQVEAFHDAVHMLGLDKNVVVVGHSLGGFHAQLYADLYPETVHGLIYVDPQAVAYVDSQGGAQAVVSRRPPFNDSTPNLTKIQRAALHVAHQFPATVETMRNHPVPKGIPVILIEAGKKWLPTPTLNKNFRIAHREMVAAATNGKLVIAEGSGHMISQEKPELIVNSVKEILDETQQR